MMTIAAPEKRITAWATVGRVNCGSRARNHLRVETADPQALHRLPDP